MIDLWNALVDPLRYEFVRNGLIAVALLGLTAGIIGAFVFVRGLTFFAHALGHTVFPGVMVALLLGQNLLIGGVLGALATVALVSLLGRVRHVAQDSAIGIVYVSLFSLGVILLSGARLLNANVGAVLVGNVLGIGTEDLIITAILAGLVALGGFLFYKELVLAAFDRVQARAIGLPVTGLDLLLLLLIACTSVVGTRAVGVLLVVSMLVIPPATARLLTDRLPRMMALGALFGALAGVVGLYLANYILVSSGGLIVLVASGLFLLVWALTRLRAWRRPALVLPTSSSPEAGEARTARPPGHPHRTSAPLLTISTNFTILIASEIHCKIGGSPMRTRLRVAVVSCGLLALLSLFGSVAWAAAPEVKFARPGRGSTVTEAPRTLEIHFSVDVNPRRSTIEVTGPDGTDATNGAVTSLRGDADAITVPLKPNLANGTYVVAWTTESFDDAIAAQGSFTFAIGPTARPGADSVAEDVDKPTGGPQTGGLPPAAGLLPLVGLGGLVALGGLGLRRRWTRR